MRQAFAQPGFRRLFTAMSTSMFGDAVMLLVLSIWVKDITGSNARAGLTFFWMVLPAIVAPLYGVLIDRVRRKPLLVWGNLASAVIVLPLLLVRSAADVWIIYVVAFLYGISFVVLPAALNGLLKELVPDQLLVEANSSLATVKEGFRLIGPLIGAAMYGLLGGGSVAVVDAVSFTVAAVLIASIRLHEDLPAERTHGWWGEMTEGVRHLVHEPVLKHVLVAIGMMLFVLGFVEATIYALLDFYDKAPTYAGVLVTVQGVGAIAGGLTTSRWVRRFGEPGALAVGLVVLSVSVAVIALASTMWVVLLGMLVCGYGIPLLFIAFSTLLQRRTPQRLMGRASAAVETLMGVPQAISLAVGAGLVVVLDFRVIFGIVAGVTLLGACYLAATLRSTLWRPVVVPVAVVEGVNVEAADPMRPPS